MDALNRRAVVKAAAVGTLAFTVGGTDVFLTPREAHAQGVPLKTLSGDEAATLAASKLQNRRQQYQRPLLTTQTNR